MSPAEVRQLLADVQGGAVSAEAAFARLSEPAVGDLGFATLDLHRKERCGFPEVILAEGKTAEWVEKAVLRMSEAGQDCYVTRVSDAQAAHLAAQFPHAQQDRLARTLWLPRTGERAPLYGNVLVVTAAPATCRWRRRWWSRPG